MKRTANILLQCAAHPLQPVALGVLILCCFIASIPAMAGGGDNDEMQQVIEERCQSPDQPGESNIIHGENSDPAIHRRVMIDNVHARIA